MNDEKQCLSEESGIHYWPNGRSGYCWCGDAFRT
jgi:hypothetical protein